MSMGIRMKALLGLLPLVLATELVTHSQPALGSPQMFKDLLKPKAKKAHDFGWTDAIHQQHKRQIVFSKTPIRFKQGQESPLEKEFTLADPIFLMAYFERSFHNQVIQEGKPERINDDASAMGVVSWSVNGTPVGGMNNYTYPIQLSADPFTKWTGASYPDDPITHLTPNSTRTLDRAFHAYVVPALKPGKNTVTMSFSFEIYEGGKKTFVPAAPMAVGEFALMVKDPGEPKAHLVRQSYLPKSQLADAKLTAEIKAAFKDEQAVSVLFLNPGWDVIRDLGGIAKRNIAFTVVLKAGDTYRAQNHIAWQDYEGAGKFGRTQVTMAPTHVMDVPSMLMK